MDPKNWTAVVNKKLLSLQNEINPFVVVGIVLMQPLLSKTTMKGKISKNQGLPLINYGKRIKKLKIYSKPQVYLLYKDLHEYRITKNMLPLHFKNSIK